ncbi:PREDICTED: uncharacterized protein C9orf117 homolog [Dufourea novaeangliae]|uniref:uncharacterized protein C9orf117 homolog n=1 Tax=Dufourea novaeangliae TaxID=178035 RepID=UPI00076768AC|nr:PREDICTED: uncharacterized protein C9orf117 homolog [Dufourea novaeangliae]
MLKAKRKKRKGGKKKVKRKCVDEKETLSYEQEILDNNRQLARLRTRNEELELESEQMKEKFRQLEEDRSDVIAHLKRNLEERIEESKELMERLSALEDLRKEELAAYKKKEESMELEYRTMENNLSAEVKLITGKLNALEDWRLARLDLMQKFEVQEKEIAEQEKRHQEELYEAEKSVVIGKAMMKKEMEERLRTLAVSLRKATNLRVAEATNRAIRENVAMNLELDELVKTCKELEVTSKESKDKERTLRLQCELFETESKITLRMAMKQRDAIHKLANLEGDISNEDCCASHLKEQFLQCLWEILGDNNIIDVLEHSASQIENISCRYSEGDLGLIESSKICKCVEEETEDTFEYSVEAESSEYFDEKQQSRSDSNISSSIQSPKESVSDSKL